MLKRVNLKLVYFYSTEIDPIQQLFINSIREYEKKKKASGGAMFDPIPELEKEREQNHSTALKQFFKNNPPSDPTSFPSFTFKDVQLDDIHLDVEKKDVKIEKKDDKIDKKDDKIDKKDDKKK